MDDNLLARVLDTLNIAVFEQLQNRSFKLLSNQEDWFSVFLPGPPDTTGSVSIKDELSYLGNFMIDAEVFWQSGAAGKLNSGIWNEVAESGEICQFEASALNLENRRILLVRMLGIGLTEEHLREQKTKEDLLAFEDLIRTEKDLEKYSTILEAEVQKRTADLNERIKELHCLYDISRLIEKKGSSLEEISRGAVDLIPAGWQYPDITCARLTVNGNVYTTDNWKETIWKQESSITLGTETIGSLAICYLEEMPPNDEGPFLNEERNLVVTLCETLSRTIKRIKAEDDLLHSYQVLSKTFEDTIAAIGKIVEIKDPYTAGHQVSVARLASAIAVEMGLPSEQVHTIRISATIHDVGKFYVPADILSKPGKLTELEFQIIKTHVQYSYDILKGIEFPWPIAQIALQHHERLDGSGYPKRLKGDEIRLEARIIAVADVVEAMTSHRPYRPSKGIDLALEEILNNRGKLYDADVADACIRLFKEKGFTLEDQAIAI
jgi:HD-GYP domain-containing protein (c-di-GMP phosphodiesterase class II)